MFLKKATKLDLYRRSFASLPVCFVFYWYYLRVLKSQFDQIIMFMDFSRVYVAVTYQPSRFSTWLLEVRFFFPQYFSYFVYSEFKVMGMIEWGQKSKSPKSPDQNLTPKISHAKFQSHKNFQKVLNNITQKKKHNNDNEMFFSFVHYTISSKSPFCIWWSW